jgi:hypothetical protein
MNLPNFFTHYFESDKGPFRNICDLSDAEIASIIASEDTLKLLLIVLPLELIFSRYDVLQMIF